MSKNRFNQFMSTGIAILITILCILFIFTDKQKFSKRAVFSENENRYLSVLPDINYKGLKKGEVTRQVEEWFSDHFIARNFFMNVRTVFERSLGKTEINNVYLAKDKFLIEKPKVNDNLKRVAGIFKNFSKKIKNADVSMMLVPTSICIYSDKLPLNAKQGSQREDMKRLFELSEVTAVDVYDDLLREAKTYDGTKTDNNLYYRTDHHWTTYGAYVAYRKYCMEKGILPLPLEKMRKNKVSSEFKGTIYSKVNDFKLSGEIMWAYDADVDLTVKYSDLDKSFDTLFAKEYLDKKDKYSYFLNNLHPYIEISNKEADNDKELVIVKDSYANCMVPMLIAHYKKIHVFDTRSYRGKVSEFVNQNPKIKDLLILYNMGTINDDTGIGGIL